MDNLSGSSILVVSGIWSIVFIGYYVWYLWSLSRLFPKIGLPSWAGWVPVWNQWQLVQRGGLPGWLVLLGLIPFLGVVVLVVLIIAINRINSEHGKGPGFTVLGVVLPPLWAMLLANHIRDSAYAAPSAGAAQPVSSGIPGFGPAPTYPEQNGADWQGLPPVPAQAYQQPQQPQPQQPQFGQPQAYAQPQQPQFAQPQQPQAQQPQQPQQPVNPQHQLWAEPVRQQVAPAPQHAPASQQAPVQPAPIPPAPSTSSTPPAPTGSIPPPPPAPVPPAPGSSATENNWGFSNTTEGAFERLAAEEAQRGGNTPLGAAQAQRQFSWPSPDPAENAEIDSRPPLVLPGPPEPVQQAPVAQRPVDPEPVQAPPVVAAPLQAPRAETPQAQPAPAAESAPAAPAEPAPVSEPASAPAQPEAAPAPVAEASNALDDDAPLIFDTGSSRRAQAPQGMQTAEDPSASEHTGTGTATATGAAVAGAAAAGTAATAAAGAAASAAAGSAAAGSAPSSSAASHDDELDRTVVVVRKTRWGLELPDGEVLELLTDDVVLGRKPEAPEGAAVLQIVDPTRTMSKTHARLRREGESWTIEDLQSTNGVAIIDEQGQASQIDAGSAVPATPRLVIGTLEVKLHPIV